LVKLLLVDLEIFVLEALAQRLGPLAQGLNLLGVERKALRLAGLQLIAQGLSLIAQS